VALNTINPTTVYSDKVIKTECIYGTRQEIIYHKLPAHRFLESFCLQSLSYYSSFFWKEKLNSGGKQCLQYQQIQTSISHLNSLNTKRDHRMPLEIQVRSDLGQAKNGTTVKPETTTYGVRNPGSFWPGTGKIWDDVKPETTTYGVRNPGSFWPGTGKKWDEVKPETTTYGVRNPGDRFTKVIVNRKSKITLKISLRARIRAFH
jgi:hypothetical protein